MKERKVEIKDEFCRYRNDASNIDRNDSVIFRTKKGLSKVFK